VDRNQSIQKARMVSCTHLATRIHAMKAYPSSGEIESVAKALVAKYPCLYEKGTVNGWSGWKNSSLGKISELCLVSLAVQK